MRRLAALFCCLIIALPFFARPQKREVIRDTVCRATVEEVLNVAERFCRQFQACPDSLFDWAYLDLGEAEVAETDSKEGRDVIQLRYKDRVYDPHLKTGDVTIDIYVLGVRWWKDQHLGSKRLIFRPSGAQYPLTEHMTATYSGSILQGGDFIMQMEPLTPDSTRVHYEFSLTFGRVLSAFISDKTWANAIQWRLSTIFDNLIECAETGTVIPKGKKN